MVQQNPPFDPRAVANSLLDFAWDYEVDVTHLQLQKTIYFLHVRYLKEYRSPLVAGYFEAWKHGPVHPQLWTSFKQAGRQPIRHHAYGLDIMTGTPRKIFDIEDKKTRLFIGAGSLEFLKMEPHRLVGLSHARSSPWDLLTRRPDGTRQYGARIPNELIAERFQFHITAVDDCTEYGEEIDEQPPS